MAAIAMPPNVLEQGKMSLDEQVSKLREEMFEEIKSMISRELSMLPKELTNMTVKEFVHLSTIAAKEQTDEVPLSVTKQVDRLPFSERKRKMNSDILQLDNKRRVTRSMARTSSIYVARDESTVPATPQLHPLLPETPAMLRKAIQMAKASDQPVESTFKRPVRIARSTIRAMPSDSNNVFKAPTHKSAKKESSDDSAVVSLELSDGKVLDVDLSKSPKSMLKGLGKEAVKEVKSKMQAYASQLRSFFKKLNF